MPLQQILPTWVALNNANFTSPTGIVDPRTGQPVAAGGLNLGDYFDITNMEALQLSYTANGILYNGRYRLVHVDSGATAGNVATGLIGYLRNGSTVTGVVAITQGISQAAGTYQVAATGGGGNGALMQVTVGSGGTLAGPPVLLQGGAGYTTAPTFTLTGTGGTAATFVAQLNTSLNDVTSYDIATGAGGTSTVRPIVFLNAITPGNYGFVQELGAATVLGNATIGAGNSVGGWVDSASGGTVVTRAATGSAIGATVGRAIDIPEASLLFKIYLTAPLGQD